MTSINQSVVLTQRIDAALVEAQTPCGAIIRPMPCARRFPPPWMIQEHARASSSATRPGLKVVKIAQTTISGRGSMYTGGVLSTEPTWSNSSDARTLSASVVC